MYTIAFGLFEGITGVENIESGRATSVLVVKNMTFKNCIINKEYKVNTLHWISAFHFILSIMN